MCVTHSYGEEEEVSRNEFEAALSNNHANNSLDDICQEEVDAMLTATGM